MKTIRTLLAATSALMITYSAHAQDAENPIQHIIVISLENHSFDNLFGHFPGAEGLSEAKRTSTQTGDDGKPLTALPLVIDTRKIPPVPDTRFPTTLPNQPFAIDKYVSSKDKTGDLVHRFYQEQEQIHGGKMDRFATVSDAGGLTMGYYNGSKLALWKYAQDYVLADHFFHAAFGGSFLNHFWLICACTPRYEGAPDGMIAKLDAQGKVIANGSITEDGYAVNTLFSVSNPHPEAIKDTTKLLPLQEARTIGDALSEKNISWAWYSGGWNDAITGHPDLSFQFHHQPFAYFKNYADGSMEKAEHLKDEIDFLDALKKDKLPAVSFYKPLGEFSLHPGYADVASGDKHIVEILQAIEKSKAWASSVVIITFDENGGYWDHMPPPDKNQGGDRWGPGVRVPTIIVSPFAKKHFVDHTVYDTTSILKFIETRFGLEPLAARDAAANDLSAALNLPK